MTKLYHPDAPQGDTEKFVAIKLAYDEVQQYMKNHSVEALREKMDARAKEEHKAQMDREAAQKAYWAKNPEEYKKHLEKERKSREAYERVFAEAERERKERVLKKEAEERARKQAYEEFLRKQKEREDKYKIKSTMTEA